MQRARLLLVTSRLCGGGSQHLIGLLAKELSRQRYDIHLVAVTATEAEHCSLPPWIEVHTLGADRVRAGALPLLRLVWKLRPDVILSGAAEVNFLALLMSFFFPRKTRILVRQNGTVSWALSHGGVPRYTRWLYRTLYPHADRVICQSRAMAEDLAGELNLAKEKIAVLPNPLDTERIRRGVAAPKSRTGPGPHLLAAGRLSHEKGFDLLLQAVALVRERFPGVDLILAGEGQEAERLKLLSKRLYLENATSLVGHVEQVCAFFPGATLFVLPSRFDAMPNSLLEAAASGLPIVAMPASEGIRELLRGQPGAWVAADNSAEALAVAMISALETLRPGDRFLRPFFPSLDRSPQEKALRDRTPQKTAGPACTENWAAEEFRFDRALEKYDELIDATARRHR